MNSQQEQNISLLLKDIKPLLEIPDNSYYFYYGSMALAILLMSALVLWLGIFLWKRRKINLLKGYVAMLKDIDWKDSKTSAYTATKYARLLATEEETQVLLSELLPLLEQYKYKKVVLKIDEKTKAKFDEFLRIADARV